jgi:hypothetical protein
VKVVRRVVSTGNKAADSVEDGDPETKYLALVENPSLLALTSGVVNDSTDGVAGTEDVLKFVDGVGTTDVTMTEDDVRSGELVEVEVVMRAGEVAGGAVEEAGRGGGLSDDETPVSDGGVWLVGDASSSVLVAAPCGPFWFPSGPGGPFLFPSRPGAFVFAGSRAARAFWKDGGFVSL